ARTFWLCAAQIGLKAMPCTNAGQGCTQAPQPAGSQHSSDDCESPSGTPSAGPPWSPGATAAVDPWHVSWDAAPEIGATDWAATLAASTACPVCHAAAAATPMPSTTRTTIRSNRSRTARTDMPRVYPRGDPAGERAVQKEPHGIAEECSGTRTINIDMGVASPRAQGQAMISTDTALSTANVQEGFGP